MARSCVSIPANSADSPRGGNHPTAGFKFMLPMLDTGHDLPLCRSITRQLVGDHDAGWPHLRLQQFSKQPHGSLLVAPAQHQYVEDYPGLVDGPPEPVLHASNLDGHLASRTEESHL